MILYKRQFLQLIKVSVNILNLLHSIQILIFLSQIFIINNSLQQQFSGAYCGQEEKLLRNVKIKVMLSEGILQQLLRKASILQQRYLYARNDCLNKCHILGINLNCELVPDDDMEVIKTAAFKHLRHMIFYQCGE